VTANVAPCGGTAQFSLVAVSAAGGVLFCDFNNGLWPSILILIGNATLIVSKHLYM
jgi:hypothetical protein